MLMRIDFNKFEQALKECGLNNFTSQAIVTLWEHYSEIEEAIKEDYIFNPPYISIVWEEYPAQEVIDSSLYIHNFEDLTKYTTAYELNNGNWLYQQF